MPRSVIAPARTGGDLPEIAGWDWTGLTALTAFIVGAGSVGRPLAEALHSLGCRRFVLSDPKRYTERSLAQCEPEEIGRHKVRCVARWLRRRGADVVAWPTSLERVEPGWAANAVVIVCGDNLRVQRVGHDVARLLQRPFFKVNLEPSYLLANVRLHDYSRRDREHGCLLCGWPPEFYALQDAAISCDGSNGKVDPRTEGPTAKAPERRTASPRALSMITAGWAAATIASTLAVDGVAERLDGQDVLLSPLGPTLQKTTVPRQPACRSCATFTPTRVDVLDAAPTEVSLDDLARRAGSGRNADAAGVRVRCPAGQLARRARCDRCGMSVSGLWRVLDVGRAVGRCACGGSQREVPFFSVASESRTALSAWWERPLAELGVRRKALIAIDSGTTSTTFVLG